MFVCTIAQIYLCALNHANLTAKVFDYVVYLIDSSIYIFRGWQSLSSSIKNTRGESFNAVTGFTETLVTVLEQTKPSWIAAAFDTRNRNAIRYRIHSEYKANRSPSPPELKLQFSQCQSVCDAFGVTQLSNEEVEADDIIGQLAVCAHEVNQPVTIVSADKDLVQFVEQDDIIWNYARKTQSNYKQLKKRFGVEPSQLADLLALCGDKTDNIPGIPGVGPRTAARLLTKWANLDGVFANIDGVASMHFRGAPHVATLLAEHEPTVRMARQLTGLITTDDLPSSIDDITYSAPTIESCTEHLVRVGFSDTDANALAKRVCKTS